MPKEPVYFEDVEVLHETDAAILVNLDGEEIWIPKSQILDESEVFDMDSSGGTLVITEWIAMEKELI